MHTVFMVPRPVGIVTNFAYGQAYGGSGGFISVVNCFAAADYKLPTTNRFARTTDINSWTHYAMEGGALTVLADYDHNGYTISSIFGAHWYPHTSSSTASPGRNMTAWRYRHAFLQAGVRYSYLPDLFLC